MINLVFVLEQPDIFVDFVLGVERRKSWLADELGRSSNRQSFLVAQHQAASLPPHFIFFSFSEHKHVGCVFVLCDYHFLLDLVLGMFVL